MKKAATNILVGEFLQMHVFFFFFCKYLYMNLLGHNIDACLTFQEITSFLKYLYHIMLPQTMLRILVAHYLHQHLMLPVFFILIILVR